MKACAELTQLLSEAQDRKLSFAEKWAMRTHLVMCKGCRNYQKQLDFLRDAVRGYTAGHGEGHPRDRAENSSVKKNPDQLP